jgi:hypothetical protein
VALQEGERLFCALFDNLVEISEIHLAFAGLYGPVDQPKLWVGKGVIDPMFLTPTDEFPRRYRPRFQRGLWVPVIFPLNLRANIGEGRLDRGHKFLDHLQISVYRKILRFVDDIPMKKAQFLWSAVARADPMRPAPMTVIFSPIAPSPEGS